MSGWPRVARERIALGNPLAMVTLLAVEGSAPREAGARMLIWASGQWGTIGGGALEYQALAQARRMLGAAGAPSFAIQDYPLGPLLAQCCGGRVRLLIERLGPSDLSWLAETEPASRGRRALTLRSRLTDTGLVRSLVSANAGHGVTVNGEAARALGPKPGLGDVIVSTVVAVLPDVRLFGAGHVGQAIARVLAPLPLRLLWYDPRPEFADETGALCLPPDALATIAGEAAPFTLILTHDHALDYALVSAALRGTEGGYLGLIGSKTKRARFTRRLRDDGFGERDLARITCPIGLAQLRGKAPEIIAVSVAADLLLRLDDPVAAASRAEPALARL